MFDIAITVSACLQAGTRADVAWLVEADGIDVTDWSDAVVFTPGGGKTGSLLGDALDAKLAEHAGRASAGRVVEVEISHVDALIAELPAGGSARCIVAPAHTLPAEMWELAAAREPFCLLTELEGGEVSTTTVYSQRTISDAAPAIGDIFGRATAGTTLTDDGTMVSVFLATPRLVVVGSGPVSEALVELSRFVGWEPRVATEGSVATGLITPLSEHDKVVIAAHDLELAGAGLTAALESDCGYVGSVGSRKMQADRADWLAYRGVTDLSRVHGPAGLDIGAGSPEEIAVAIVAEAIASERAS